MSVSSVPASSPAAPFPAWRPRPPRPALVALPAALGLALAVGAAVGFGLRSLWPWVFAEAASGAALGLGLVFVLRAARASRRLIAGAAALVVVGFLLGQWVALARSAPTPLGLAAFLQLKLESEPLLGDLRLGPLGNVVVLAAEWLVVGASAWLALTAFGAARGHGTPSVVRRFVADAWAGGASEAEIRGALAARGWTDADAQTEAIQDGARQRAAARPSRERAGAAAARPSRERAGAAAARPSRERA